MVKVREDMTGWVMSNHGVPDSKLTVIKQVEDYVSVNGRHRDQWLCECSCEEKNTIIVTGAQLKSGKTRSCGCLAKEHIINKNKNTHKVNQYDLSGDYGVCWTSNTNKEFYFDLEDYDKIKDICWSEYIDHNGYHSIRGWDRKTNTNILFVHVIVGKYYDHIDRNPFNNRKYNLRPATVEENSKNKNVRIDNSSGFIGVAWDESTCKWIAYVQINKNNTHLGYFANKVDAIVARLNAEAKYYGEFAPQRHLFETYGVDTNVAVNIS